MGPLSLCPRDLGKASELTTSDCSGRPGPADGSNKPPKFFHTACPRVTLWKLCGAQIKAERALGSSRNHGNALPQLCHRTATSPKWHSTPDIFIYPWVKPRFFLGDGSIGRDAGNQLVAGTFGSVDDVKQFQSCSRARVHFPLSNEAGRAEPNRSTQAGAAVQCRWSAVQAWGRFLRGKKLYQSI